jgi:hypothetical protein
MKINNRQQLLGMAAIGAVVLWAAVQLIINPLWNSWKARGDRIQKLKQQVASGTNTLAHADSIQKQWDNMRANTLNATNVSAAESQMLTAISRWERDSNVTVSGWRPQWKKGDDEHYMTLDCRVDASGDIQTLTRFIYEIEKDPLGAKVDSVVISSRNPDGQALTLSLLINGLQIKQ